MALTVNCSTGKDELLETAMALHDAAMKDDYFVSRKLAPNVDFWSGLIYRAMGHHYLSPLTSCLRTDV
jgi:citrate synthase